MGAHAFSRAAKCEGVSPQTAASSVNEKGASVGGSVSVTEGCEATPPNCSSAMFSPNNSQVRNFGLSEGFHHELGMALCQALTNPRGIGLVQAVPNEAQEAQAGQEDEEAQVARPLPAPDQPTEQMIREHEVSHIPYRAWCTACLRGRGRTMPHVRIDHSEDALPTLSMDYGYLGDGLPFVVIRDRKSRAIFAHLLPHKGASYSSYPERAVLRDLALLGYKRFVVKSDQESSMKALREAVANGSPAEVVTEDAPKGDAHGQSNGEAERAVQTIQGMVRTLVAQIELKTGETLANTSPIISWAVEHASHLHLLFSKDTEVKDGLTPFQRIKGRAWQVQLPCFGEVVEFRKRTESKAEPRWDSGVFLGIRVSSSEKVIGTAQGIFVVQSIKRKPPAVQWSMDALKEFKGLPWNLKPDAPLALPAPADVAPELPDAQGPLRPVPPKEEVWRRMYLRKADFDKHGYTAGCNACDALREGRSRAGIIHSEHCRKRLIDLLKDTSDGQERLQANADREERFLARAVEQADKRLKSEAQKEEEPQANPSSASSTPPQSALRQKRPLEDEICEPSAKQKTSPIPAQASSRTSRKRPAEAVGDDDRVAIRESDTRALPQKRLLEPGGDLNALLASGEELIEGALLAHRKAILASLAENNPSRPLADIKDEFEPWFLEQTFYDNISGKELPSKGVMDARYEELQVIQEMNVWEVIPRPPGERTVGTRWVDVNKGDSVNQKLRSRLVAQELRRKSQQSGMPDGHWTEFFAAMPPLSAMKALFAIATTQKVPDASGKLRSRPVSSVLMFLDIKKAHFWAPARRRILIELPAELGVSRDYVGLLHRSLYGTRDAPSNWEMAIRDVMEKLEFEQGKSSPCLYFHQARNILCSVHGDDFMILSTHVDALCLRDQLAKEWTVETRGIMAPPGSGISGAIQQLSVLNRLVTWTQNGLELEADPRHVDIVLQESGLSSGSSVTSPLVKLKAMDETDDEALSDEDAARYRSLSMRIGYLSLDRPDLLRATRELAKGLQNPTRYHWSLLKRIARYLKGHGRLVQKFDYQEKFVEITVWSDADHGGCIRTRKSTTGTVVVLGNSCIDVRCKGQAIIALSTAEAEFYGLISSASHGLGEQSMLRGWGIHCPLVVNMDASSGIAIGSRRGLGRVKHIDISFLWTQECIQDCKIRLRKRDTKEMFADLMTKATDGPRIMYLLALMRYEFKCGRHPFALSV